MKKGLLLLLVIAMFCLVLPLSASATVNPFYSAKLAQTQNAVNSSNVTTYSYSQNAPINWVDGNESTIDGITTPWHNIFKFTSSVDATSFYYSGPSATAKFFSASGTELQSVSVTQGTNTIPLSLSQVQYVDIQLTVNGSIAEISLNGGTPPPTTAPNAPLNLQGTPGNAKVDLTWSAANGADGYHVKRALTQGGPYTTIGANITGTTFSDPSLTNGTTYYYVVSAINSIGEGQNSNEVSVTPVAPTDPETPAGERAILTIYLDGGQVKEYDLSAAQLASYLTWFEDRSNGEGPAKYKFVKTWNKGPFKTRAEYVIFDKILTFNVDEYDVSAQ